ncbi:putative metal chaperone [Lachnospiraceae bacterium KM106-2]|nr:putative metal chaperone [Lachnospiraceae bacterium KM106-2]
MDKIPVTILTGYLGSGKTTVMNELIKAQSNKKFALVVNDIGSVNIDAKLIKNSNVHSMDSKMIELQNGCICCTLRDEFMFQLEELAQDEKMEAILVEASGVSNPSSIAEGFMMYKEMHQSSKVYLHSVVTVVDADRIYSEFLDELENHGDHLEDDPDIINLVMDQIEFCNLILLNKCDLLPASQIEQVKKVIHHIQPQADIIETIQGKVDPAMILESKQFDYEQVYDSSAIQRALNQKNEETEDHDEYGITSFVYETRRPFDHKKFMSFIETDYPKSLIRAKGYIWFAHDDIHVQLFEQAGRNATINEVSNWVASFDEEEQKNVFEQYPEVLEDWDERYGDRLNQIVFIGKAYDKQQIITQLNLCLEG